MRVLRFAFVLSWGLVVWSQTDETIFREFRFDFSTPGARANAMGRAFVGLADEATAAFNNPAGLSVLAAPEFSFEYRHSETDYDVLRSNEDFELQSGTVHPFSRALDQITFASFSFSSGLYNFSVFYVNQLEYRRSTNEPEQTRWQHVARGYEFTHINDHRADMRLFTAGLGISRRFGKLALGLAAGVSQLDLDYRYQTFLTSDYFPLDDLVLSRAVARHRDLSLVLGSMVQIHPRVKWGLVYKRQPKFSYLEYVNNPTYPPDRFPQGEPFAITFKVPDSAHTGLSVQPNDFLTILLDLDWIRYDQLGGGNMTIISGDNFSVDDYVIPDVVEVHVGGEYLVPYRKHIFAFRAGWFLDPEHKTQFVRQPDSELSQIQRFIFNTGDGSDDRGWTCGLGYVWNNRVQFDTAWIRSDRFNLLVGSFLYRF